MLTEEVVILADGLFPEHPVPISFLKSGRSIVCCDGAAIKLLAVGMEPDCIIGDLDSLPLAYKQRYAEKLFHDPDQETNDLTKAVAYCVKNGVKKAFILGATGLREDHTLGNISLLISYSESLEVEMHTDSGWFVPVTQSKRLNSTKGQQISIFSLTPDQSLTLENLKFPLNNRPLSAWWEGTLNEAIGDWFGLKFKEGKFIVFQLY